ncbi:MAG: hypothetical protein WCU88_03995 [Elusimicrobiota bacterium]|jgi:hypothetical protein
MNLFTLRRLLCAMLCAGWASSNAHGYGSLTGGPYLVTALASNSGAGVSANGRYRQTYTFAATFSAPMSNGAYTLLPGPIAAVRTSRDDLSAAHAFPVPFEPHLGHDKITFTRLTAACTIDIYTLAGEKVYSLSKNDISDRIEWSPVANGRGSALASGVYIYVINAPGLPSKRGKLMVIR